MLLSANLIRIKDAFGLEKTFDVLQEVGFKAVDFSLDMAEYRTANYDKNFYLNVKKYANDRGIVVGQAHAPFPSAYPDETKTKERFNEIVKAIENASYLGAPMIVVHPCFHLEDKEELYKYNLEFYKKLIPYAEKFGVKIAIENIVNAIDITATPEALNKLYNELNNPVFTICFDVGHSVLFKVDPAEAIKKIGHRLVNGCTHIHDNNGVEDSHTLPYYGITEWDSVMKALAEIGYKGNCSYEASRFFKYVPEDLFYDGLIYKAKVGYYLIDKFNKYKKEL